MESSGSSATSGRNVGFGVRGGGGVLGFRVLGVLGGFGGFGFRGFWGLGGFGGVLGLGGFWGLGFRDKDSRMSRHLGSGVRFRKTCPELRVAGVPTLRLEAQEGHPDN